MAAVARTQIINHRQRRLLRAGNGHATAAPLRTLMKSRCLIASPRLSRRDIVAGQICTLEVGRREEVQDLAAANVADGSFSTDQRCLRDVRFPPDRDRIAALRQVT